ncbi:MAG TPA: bifunctional UDP-N-acetylglucosamine diphosphorylase/glucosamine-1-phosphate N-acetyltransferase GlmU [Anaerolineaceae bacterium]|nr:bifunctional UDP-N-acetylglucosamine diphosphorylase/glucosamine-1-phosphate N-acetyltransferase GlmU [Anaerolineaceae bacterium]
MTTCTPIILAAGQGVRMRSTLPKVLHAIGGRPLLQHVLLAVAGAGLTEPVVVVGHGAEAVRTVAGGAVRCVTQLQQLGTANAVQAAEELLSGKTDLVLVVNGDMPLLTSATLSRLVDLQRENPGPLTLLTLITPDPRGFGRIVRDAAGAVQAIVEEAQATPEQLAITELNAGAYCFRASWLWDALRSIPLSPKGEYYLTDTVSLAVSSGLSVQAVCLADPVEAMGINTRIHLAEAEALLRRRVNTALMLSGVTMIDPAHTYIETGVQIGADTVIYPNTHLRGDTRIGLGCTIGPNTILEDTQVGDRCVILASVTEKAVIEDDVSMGPFCRLRKGAHLKQGVHMGNFGEVKDSILGPGTKMGHFSYIGNATIGANVNIGAGTITCNYDGEHKHPTEIGDDVFVGSDTMLVAPIKLGPGSRTGAGAVVTHDVAPGEVVVGVPARPLRRHTPSE